jgi:hypothetical protein
LRYFLGLTRNSAQTEKPIKPVQEHHRLSGHLNFYVAYSPNNAVDSASHLKSLADQPRKGLGKMCLSISKNGIHDFQMQANDFPGQLIAGSNASRSHQHCANSTVLRPSCSKAILDSSRSRLILETTLLKQQVN